MLTGICRSHYSLVMECIGCTDNHIIYAGMFYNFTPVIGGQLGLVFSCSRLKQVASASTKSYHTYPLTFPHFRTVGRADVSSGTEYADAYSWKFVCHGSIV